MDEMTEWSETDKTLYVVAVAILALVAALVLLTVATSGSRHAAAASAIPAKADTTAPAVAQRERDSALATRHKLYNDCLEGMGVQTGLLARIMRPDSQKRKFAAEVCGTLVQNRVLNLPAAKDRLVPGSA